MWLYKLHIKIAIIMSMEVNNRWTRRPMTLMKRCLDSVHALTRRQTVKTRLTWLINLSY
jgi:hypothetical protein